MRAARERERKRLAAKGRKHREERKAQELSKRRPTLTGPVRVRLNRMKEVESGVKCMLDFKSPIQGTASTRSNTCSRRRLRAGNSAIEVSPRRPPSTTPMFSSAEYCFRVARRMSRTSFSDVAGVQLDFSSSLLGSYDEDPPFLKPLVLSHGS
jgi:hypothetical protein